MGTTTLNERLLPPELTDAEKQMAAEAGRLIMMSLDHSRAARIVIESDDGSMPSVEVSPAVLKVIGKMLSMVSRKQPLVLVPEKHELTTAEAASYLHVSRPFLIKELQAGKMPYHMVGTHRRVLFKDVRAYKDRMRVMQQEALDRMADDARDLGLEY